MMHRPDVAPRAAVRAWYREPWPWLLMSGPTIVVIAGFYTLWLAIVSNDGLVVDDYYKQGLAINKVLTRERVAAASHYEARVMFAPGEPRIRVVLTGSVLPRELTVRLVHPTRAGMDQSAQLAAVGAGVYEGVLALPSPGRWELKIEDAAATWRLTGEARLPGDEPIVLGGAGR